MNYKSRSLMALAFGVVAGSAFAQSSFVLPGPITVAGPAGDIGNTVISVPAAVATTFVSAGAASIIANVTTPSVMTRVNSANTPSDMRVRLRNSSLPNGVFDFQLSNGGVYTAGGTLAILVAGRSATSATINGCVIPAGSTWTVEFFTVVDNAGTECTINNVSFNLPVGSALPTNVLQSIDVSGTFGGPIPTFGFLSNPLNTIVTVPDNQTSGSKFIANGGWILDSAAISKPATLLQAATTLTVFVRHSTSGGVTTVQPWFGSVLNNQANWTNYQAGQKVAPKATYNHNNAVLTGGGNWTFEFYESTLTPDIDQDGQWDDLKLKITGTAFSNPNQAMTWTGAIDSVDSPGDADNLSIPIGTASANFTLSPTMLYRATATAGATPFNFARDSVVRFYNSAYKFDYAEILYNSNVLLNQNSINGTGTDSSAINAFEQLGSYFVNGGLINRPITSGSTWTAELSEDRDDTASGSQWEVDNDGVAARTYNSMTFGTYGATYVPPTPPTATVDLGALIGGDYTAATGAFTASQVKWVKFTIPEIDKAAGEFIDIWTQPNANTITVGRLTDSVIALYTEDGRLIQQDDDDSFNFNSCLSFGLNGVDSRASKTTTSGDSWSNSKTFNGRDGNGLDAGTYFVGVINWSGSAGFNRGFAFAGTGTAQANGTNVRIQMGTGRITGNVDFPDFIPIDVSTVPTTYELRDGADAVVVSGPLTLAANGDYKILTTVAAGTYTLTVKSSHWLKEGKTVNVGSVNPAINFSLLNGDADGDNFIGLDDFNVLSDSFNLALGDPGYAANADFDGDDFVGLDDFNILSNNFNLGGYGS